jgi:hypothetical protein
VIPGIARTEVSRFFILSWKISLLSNLAHGLDAEIASAAVTTHASGEVSGTSK